MSRIGRLPIPVPSGVDIARNVEKGLREFAPGTEINFERIAVNPDQIDEFDLQTRPTKKSDTRTKGFQGGSVEVDAIPATMLRELVEDAIECHIDEDELERLKERLLAAELARTTRLETNVLLRRAANEAVSLVWLTPYPLLLLPALFAEKAQAARRHAGRQALIRERSSELLALAE